MANNEQRNTLCKIVYYDEESIADYIQIDNGANWKKHKNY